jgi:DNA-binding NtrC family response regulator
MVQGKATNAVATRPRVVGLPKRTLQQPVFACAGVDGRITLTMRRMLIVEDERDIAECLADFFTARGFAVASSFSGEEALDKLDEETVDVILLDILLPGISGIEVLRRAKVKHPNATVVMVTSLDQIDLRQEAHRCGAAAYVTKPFDFSTATWSAVLSSQPA